MVWWAALTVGIVGVVLGNLLTRSMEFRKWHRTERHKACAQLLDASLATVQVAAYHKAAPEAVGPGVQEVGQVAVEALRSMTNNRALRLVLRPLAKRFARRMNPDVTPRDLDETFNGILIHWSSSPRRLSET